MRIKLLLADYMAFADQNGPPAPDRILLMQFPDRNWLSGFPNRKFARRKLVSLLDCIQVVLNFPAVCTSVGAEKDTGQGIVAGSGLTLKFERHRCVMGYPARIRPCKVNFRSLDNLDIQNKLL